MRGLRYVEVGKETIRMPLIVVENHSNIEIRDCLLRSTKPEAS
jgi:hypothetical protein